MLASHVNARGCQGRALAKNPKHIYLQVEGASIDKQDHAAAPCEQIGETIAFDNAIQVALAFAKAHPRTLIVVTADHSHSSQIVDVGAPILGPGSILTTKADKAPMEITTARPRRAARATRARSCASQPMARSRPTWSACTTRNGWRRAPEALFVFGAGRPRAPAAGEGG